MEFPFPDTEIAIFALLSLDGGIISVLTSDGLLATVALIMAAILVKPRIRARLRAEPTVAQRAIVELGGTVFCFVAHNGVVRSITPNAREVLGDACDRAAELELAFGDLVQPESRTRLDNWMQRAWQPEPPPPLTLATRGPTTGRRWLELATPGQVNLTHGRAILVEIREVTDQAERSHHARLLARSLDAGADPAFITDIDGRFVYVNTAFEEALGYRSDEVLGRPTALLNSGQHRADFFARMWQVIGSGQVFSGEVVNRRADGSLCTMDLVITRLDGDDSTPPRYVAVARDVSGRRQMEHAGEAHAFYDALTGLPNHRLLQERARQVLALARRHGTIAGLLHLDITGLGAVNAQHGRKFGDDVLRRLAERLRQNLRESDSLARVGSDEFLVLLPEVEDHTAVARLVRRLTECVAEAFTIRDRTASLRSRVGVALYPRDASTFEDLLSAADAALQRARQASTPFEFFEHRLSAITQDRLLLEDDLHWAWERDQFVLHYQHIVAAGQMALRNKTVGTATLARHQAAGVEALARWPHMERGLLEPSTFLPLAERTGRIVALDRWALNTAVKQAVEWQGSGWNGWVSVNLSALSLQDPELVDHIARTLDAHGLDGSHLVLEITEGAVLGDPARTVRVLEALRRRGVRSALDDFGVGQSSLSCLNLYPVDLLKLDRCFTSGIGKTEREEQLLETMITLAHGMGAEVIAEGVEERAQLDWLRDAGCDYVQGFLIGRPAPAETAAQSAPAPR
jgi:diguanylate cyclase (GGDEF)-like protein/PAS domain S-box-containing protein